MPTVFVASFCPQVSWLAQSAVTSQRSPRPGPWLQAVTTRNKVGDFIRRERRRNTTSGAAPESWDALPAAVGAVGAGVADEDAERALLVRQAIEAVRAEFEPASYEMARLQLMEGRSAADAGATRGKSANAAYIAKCRVKNRLREILGRFEIWDAEQGPPSDLPGARS